MSRVDIRVEIRDNAEFTCVAAAQSIAAALRTAQGLRGRASLAVSGGKTPARMLRVLADQLGPWNQIDVFQVDERIAPDGHADRNATSLVNSLRPTTGEPTLHLMPMPVDDSEASAQAACNEYELLLPLNGLDVIHLGLGDDGHTASLIPGDPVLGVETALVWPTGEYQGRRRLTLTTPTIRSAGVLIWLAIGPEKAPMIRRLLADDQTIPAGRFADRPGILFMDRAAAEELDWA